MTEAKSGNVAQKTVPERSSSANSNQDAAAQQKLKEDIENKVKFLTQKLQEFEPEKEPMRKEWLKFKEKEKNAKTVLGSAKFIGAAILFKKKMSNFLSPVNDFEKQISELKNMVEENKDLLGDDYYKHLLNIVQQFKTKITEARAVFDPTEEEIKLDEEKKERMRQTMQNLQKQLDEQTQKIDKIDVKYDTFEQRLEARNKIHEILQTVINFPETFEFVIFGDGDEYQNMLNLLNALKAKKNENSNKIDKITLQLNEKEQQLWQEQQKKKLEEQQMQEQAEQLWKKQMKKEEIEHDIQLLDGRLIGLTYNLKMIEHNFNENGQIPPANRQINELLGKLEAFQNDIKETRKAVIDNKEILSDEFDSLDKSINRLQTNVDKLAENKYLKQNKEDQERIAKEMKEREIELEKTREIEQINAQAMEEQKEIEEMKQNQKNIQQTDETEQKQQKTLIFTLLFAIVTNVISVLFAIVTNVKTTRKTTLKIIMYIVQILLLISIIIGCYALYHATDLFAQILIIFHLIITTVLLVLYIDELFVHKIKLDLKIVYTVFLIVAFISVLLDTLFLTIY